MLITLLLGVVTSLAMALFYLLPSLPQFPAFLTDGLDFFINLLGQAISFVSYIYTPPMFIFSITAILLIMNFKAVYHLTMFVVRKVVILLAISKL